MDKSVSLVTGAAGFIGAHLAARLLAEGDRVHVLVRSTTSLARIEHLTDRLTVHRLDLHDREATRQCLSGIAPDRVFHLAAETRPTPEPGFIAARAAFGHYVDPTLNLVEALAGLAEPPSVVVRAGTIAEYGGAELPYSELGRTCPLTPYGAGMLAATNCLTMLAPALPFPVVTARLALCYGPGQSRNFLIPALADALLSGRATTIQRPEDRRDLLHVDDAVAALLRIAELAPSDCGVVNIGSGTAPTMREVAERLIALTGCPPALVTYRRPLPGERPVELRCAADLARRRFGWEARIHLEEGLRGIVEAERRTRSLAGQLP